MLKKENLSSIQGLLTALLGEETMAKFMEIFELETKAFMFNTLAEEADKKPHFTPAKVISLLDQISPLIDESLVPKVSTLLEQIRTHYLLIVAHLKNSSDGSTNSKREAAKRIKAICKAKGWTETQANKIAVHFYKQHSIYKGQKSGSAKLQSGIGFLALLDAPTIDTWLEEATKKDTNALTEIIAKIVSTLGQFVKTYYDGMTEEYLTTTLQYMYDEYQTNKGIFGAVEALEISQTTVLALL